MFVEKPMALDEDEAAAMVDAAVETGTKLGVSHNLLFSRSVSSARRRIDVRQARRRQARPRAAGEQP